MNKSQIRSCVRSFRLMDNYLHVHACRYFHYFVGKTTTMFTVWCRHAHSDLQSSEAFLYVIERYNIMFTWTYISVLGIKGKHNFELCYCIHIIELSTNKGEHSYKFNISNIGKYNVLTPLSWNHCHQTSVVQVTL